MAIFEPVLLFAGDFEEIFLAGAFATTFFAGFAFATGFFAAAFFAGFTAFLGGAAFFAGRETFFAAGFAFGAAFLAGFAVFFAVLDFAIKMWWKTVSKSLKAMRDSSAHFADESTTMPQMKESENPRLTDALRDSC
jgi:hypothetical protein